jgi:Trk K+ transport system NAD-binding subunit
MEGWKRRAVGYLAFIGVALVVTALGYQWGMRVYEGRPRTFLDSLQFAVEMFTTTGFGGDSPWDSPEMQAFIAVTDLLGMAILVGALPVLIGPLLETALSTEAPQRLDSSIQDHVVICSYTTRAEELIKELGSRDVPYVIVEADENRANELYDDDHRVIKANPESTAGLEAAKLPAARALFADVSDQVDASIVLAAKELAEDVPVVSVVEAPSRAKYHRLAGADHVLSPRELLGESFAQKVTTAVRSRIDEAVEIGDRLQLAEVSVRYGSRLAGTRLADSEIRTQSGVNVIGAWVHGEFDASPSPEMTLQPGTVLLVSGHTAQLEELVEMTQTSVRSFGTGDTVIIGYGAVGRTVAAELDDAGIPNTVVDQTEMEGVDVVGDATKTETLTAAGIEDTQTVVLALPDDTTTEFATLVIRDLAPNAEIIARVQKNQNISKTYRAGGNYVLSLARVTGRMSISYLLKDRNVLSLDQQIEVAQTRSQELVGRTIRDANIRERTGCTLIAIKRNSNVITDIGPETAIEPDDELVIVGTDSGIREFEQRFG